MRYPVDQVHVTSPFGDRILGGKPDEHYGTDYRAAIGTPIYPIAPGVVKVAKLDSGTAKDKNKGYGLYVLIDHGDYCTLSTHLSSLEAVAGDKVDEDTIIGLSGDTGHAIGPHLHHEVRNVPYNHPELWVKRVNAQGKGVPIHCIDGHKFISDTVKGNVETPNSNKIKKLEQENRYLTLENERLKGIIKAINLASTL